MCSSFKKKAPKAIKEIRKFAKRPWEQLMSEWMLTVKLNKHVWSHGIQSLPRRVRVHIARNRNDEEDAKEEFFYTSHCCRDPSRGLKGVGHHCIYVTELLFLQNFGLLFFLLYVWAVHTAYVKKRNIKEKIMYNFLDIVPWVFSTKYSHVIILTNSIKTILPLNNLYLFFFFGKQ